MPLSIRPIDAADAAACGSICYAAFQPAGVALPSILY
jgi:hypothetical protein